MRKDFAARYGPWALVAGASEGIGAAYARRLASAGLAVVLLARRTEPLDALAAELRDEHGVETRTAAIDLTAIDAVEQVASAVRGLEVGLLIYNAGAVHGAQLFVDGPVADALHLVDLNCRTVVGLTHLLAGPMVKRERGGIILMSSLAGAAGSGYTAVYSATKAFDLVLAEALWMELGQFGVDVVGVPAGLTDTPAMRRSGIVTDGGAAMAADDVATEVLGALGAGGPHAIPGRANRTAAAHFWPVERQQLVRALTDGATALYGRPHIPTPSS